jgi:hypothetical protein
LYFRRNIDRTEPIIARYVAEGIGKTLYTKEERDAGIDERTRVVT